MSAMVFAGLFSISCEKQEVTTVKDAEVIDAPVYAPPQEWGLHRTFHPCGEDGEPFCETPKLDCFDEIVVVAERTKSLDKFLACENEEISNFFKTAEGRELIPSLNDDVINDLQNREFSKRQIVSGNTTFVILTNKNKGNDDPDYVFPFVIVQ